MAIPIDQDIVMDEDYIVFHPDNPFMNPWGRRNAVDLGEAGSAENPIIISSPNLDTITYVDAHGNPPMSPKSPISAKFKRKLLMKGSQEGSIN